MSSWFSSFSLPNPFKSEEDDDGDNDEEDDNNYYGPHKPSTPNSPSSSSSSPTAAPALNHDFSALSQTFSHRLRGVAAFLAPPPSPSSTVATSSAEEEEPDYSSSEAITGIKNDLVEIGGNFKSLLSSSSNKAVSEISKFASSFLQFRDDGVIDDDYDYRELEDVAGINEEIVDFAREISLRPQLWTDFPLSLPNDFIMTEAQIEHATTMEQLVPALATSRQKICSHLSNAQFWMIYFILLLPRLNETDMELLSTSEISQARETLLQNLHNKRNAQVETVDSEAPDSFEVDPKVNKKQGDGSCLQRDNSSKNANTGGEIQEVETGKSEESSKEKAGPGKSASSWKHSENVEDVSFSDLEDEDNDLADRLSAQKLAHGARLSSASESNEWVGVPNADAKGGLSATRGKDSEGEESNGWFTVDDTDLESLGAV